jgi:hypothetical protein
MCSPPQTPSQTVVDPQTACVENDAQFTSCARLLLAKTESCFPDRMLLQPCNVKFIYDLYAFSGVVCLMPIPVAAQSKAARFLGLRVRILREQGCMSLVSVGVVR